MRTVLLVDDDLTVLDTCGRALQLAGYVALKAPSVASALTYVSQDLDAAIIDLKLPDGNGLEVLRALQQNHGQRVPALIVSGCGGPRDGADAIRLGAAEVLEKPVFIDALVEALERVMLPIGLADGLTAHAATRWARAVVPIVASRSDVRTIADWAHLIAAAPGTIRNWCHTADIGARRSLIFGRLLRVVALSNGGRHRPEDLLDAVDRRTLLSLFRMAGLRNLRDVPPDVFTFIERQCLIDDEEAIAAVKTLLPATLGQLPRL